MFKSNSLSKYERIMLEMYISMNDSMKGNPIQKTTAILLFDLLMLLLLY